MDGRVVSIERVRMLESSIESWEIQYRGLLIQYNNTPPKSKLQELMVIRNKLMARLSGLGVDIPVYFVEFKDNSKVTYSAVTEEVARDLAAKNFPGKEIKSISPIELGILQSI